MCPALEIGVILSPVNRVVLTTTAEILVKIMCYIVSGARRKQAAMLFTGISVGLNVRNYIRILLCAVYLSNH